MPLHHVKEGKLEKFEKIAVDKEKKIEDFIERHPKILGEDIFIIGRQVKTPAGIPDLLGLDKDGNLVIVELKKGLPARKIVAQILDYAVWGEDLQYDDLNKIAKEKHLKNYPDLYKKFEKDFGGIIPEPFNFDQRLFLISEEFDEKTIEICRYLKRNGIHISCIEMNFHGSGKQEIVDTNQIVGSEETKSEEFGEDSTLRSLLWKERLEQRASPENKQKTQSIILKIEEKFGFKGEPHGKWYYICTKLPYQRKNLFAVILVGKEVCNIAFRIDPNTFEGDVEVRTVKGFWFPRGTERRIKLSDENESLILKCIEHSLEITK